MNTASMKVVDIAVRQVRPHDMFRIRLEFFGSRGSFGTSKRSHDNPAVFRMVKKKQIGWTMVRNVDLMEGALCIGPAAIITLPTFVTYPKNFWMRMSPFRSIAGLAAQTFWRRFVKLLQFPDAHYWSSVCRLHSRLPESYCLRPAHNPAIRRD
jgi:hypothetical protein